MSIITSQQLAHYFEQYKSTDVTFNKQVIAATGLVARNVYLKLLDRQIPCIVFSSSMSGAKVIASIKSSVFAALKQNNNRLALRWCFKLPDKAEPITFFVTCHAATFTHYAVQDPDVQIMTLEFTQHPPDDLIQILGTLLEASCNAQRRKDERIVITPETMKKLGLESREASLIVDGTAHLCVLRDLSFSGAKVLAPGFAATLAGKTASLKIAKGEQAVEMTLPGVIRRIEEVGGRKDILAVGIEYSSDPPMTYKLLINSYLSTMRKTCKDPEKAETAETHAAGAAAAAAPATPPGDAAPASAAAPSVDPASAIPDEEDGPADG
ncbi:MAG: PilZ domain-containing protein [Spirochaetia bacterium]